MVKPIFFTIATLALAWGLLTQSGGLLLRTYKVGFGAAFWGYAYLIFYDMFCTWRGKNSDYLKRFYTEIFLELCFAFLASLSAAIVYVYDTEKYSFSNIDIAATGFPFALFGIYKIIKTIKLKINEIEKNNAPLILFAILASFGYIFAIFLSIKISSNTYGVLGSLWIQISILLASFYAYVESSRMYYFISNKRVEISKPLLKLFQTKLVSGYKLYEQASNAADIWNAEVAKNDKLKKEKNA